MYNTTNNTLSHRTFEVSIEKHQSWSLVLVLVHYSK